MTATFNSYHVLAQLSGWHSTGTRQPQVAAFELNLHQECSTITADPTLDLIVCISKLLIWSFYICYQSAVRRSLSALFPEQLLSL